MSEDTLTRDQLEALVAGEDPPDLWNPDRGCIKDAVTRAIAAEVLRLRLALDAGPVDVDLPTGQGVRLCSACSEAVKAAQRTAIQEEP